METIKFEAGNIYEMRFICDSDLRVNYVCLSRTAKKVNFGKVGSKEIISRMNRLVSNTE